MEERSPEWLKGPKGAHFLYSVRAALHLTRGEMREAQVSMAKAVELRPKHRDFNALLFLSIVQDYLDEPEESTKALQAAIDSGCDMPDQRISLLERQAEQALKTQDHDVAIARATLAIEVAYDANHRVALPSLFRYVGELAA